MTKKKEITAQDIIEMKVYKVREDEHSSELFYADDPGEDQQDFDRYATIDDLRDWNEDGEVEKWAAENGYVLADL